VWWNESRVWAIASTAVAYRENCVADWLYLKRRLYEDCRRTIHQQTLHARFVILHDRSWPAKPACTVMLINRGSYRLFRLLVAQLASFNRTHVSHNVISCSAASWISFKRFVYSRRKHDELGLKVTSGKDARETLREFKNWEKFPRSLYRVSLCVACYLSRMRQDRIREICSSDATVFSTSRSRAIPAS